jgi:hypothetical protein
VGVLLSLLIPFVIPVGLTFWLGRTRLRTLILLGLGPAAIGVWFLVGIVTGPRTVEEAHCHHCGEYFGTVMDPVNFFFLAFWLALWVPGVGLGAAIRHQRQSRLAA